MRGSRGPGDWRWIGVGAWLVGCLLLLMSRSCGCGAWLRRAQATVGTDSVATRRNQAAVPDECCGWHQQLPRCDNLQRLGGGWVAGWVGPPTRVGYDCRDLEVKQQLDVKLGVIARYHPTRTQNQPHALQVVAAAALHTPLTGLRLTRFRQLQRGSFSSKMGLSRGASTLNVCCVCGVWWDKKQSSVRDEVANSHCLLVVAQGQMACSSSAHAIRRLAICDRGCALGALRVGNATGQRPSPLILGRCRANCVAGLTGLHGME